MDFNGHENIILGNPKLTNTKVNFRGKGNILFCEKNVIIENSLITFSGDNSIIFLSENKSSYKLRIQIYTDCSLYFGKNNFMTGTMTFIIQEYSNIIIGNNNLFSTNILFRTSDAHAIYDINQEKRINPSRNIILGDHVWLCSNVNIFKNSEIGSGSIVGSHSLVTNKQLNSNSLNVGIPVNEIKTNICYNPKFVGNDSIKNYKHNNFKEEDIFHYVEDELLLLNEFRNESFSLLNIKEKLDFFKEIHNNDFKNRFFRNDEIFEKIKFPEPISVSKYIFNDSGVLLDNNNSFWKKTGLSSIVTSEYTKLVRTGDSVGFEYISLYDVSNLNIEFDIYYDGLRTAQLISFREDLNIKFGLTLQQLNLTQKTWHHIVCTIKEYGCIISNDANSNIYGDIRGANRFYFRIGMDDNELRYKNFRIY